MADIAQHNSRQSCWTSIDGSVYDVTKWIDQHPGGAEAILSLCGTDGSAAFNAQHNGQRRPEAELASFRIGALK
jgi:cytochrome b involved in lipid metabolism